MSPIKLVGQDLMLMKRCTECERLYPYPVFATKIVKGRVKRGSVCANCRGVNSVPQKVGQVKRLYW